MNLELVAILAIVVTSAIEIAGIVILGVMAYRMNGKMTADDAAIFLQGRRIEEIPKEMREGR